MNGPPKRTSQLVTNWVSSDFRKMKPHLLNWQNFSKMFSPLIFLCARNNIFFNILSRLLENRYTSVLYELFSLEFFLAEFFKSVFDYWIFFVRVRIFFFNIFVLYEFFSLQSFLAEFFKNVFEYWIFFVRVIIFFKHLIEIAGKEIKIEGKQIHNPLNSNQESRSKD